MDCEKAARRAARYAASNNGLAAAFRPRVPLRHNRKENGTARHVQQVRRWRAQLFHQELIDANGTHICRRGSASAAFLCLAGERQPTTLDSHSLLHPFLGDLLERPPIAVKRGMLTGQLLPARDDDIDVLGIKLQPVANSLCQFSSGERGTGT